MSGQRRRRRGRWRRRPRPRCQRPSKRRRARHHVQSDPDLRAVGLKSLCHVAAGARAAAGQQDLRVCKPFAAFTPWARRRLALRRPSACRRFHLQSASPLWSSSAVIGCMWVSESQVAMSSNADRRAPRPPGYPKTTAINLSMERFEGDRRGTSTGAVRIPGGAWRRPLTLPAT